MNKSIRQTSIVAFALALLLLAAGAMQMRSAGAAQPTQGKQAQVSPERLLPGDSTIGNAGFSQENPQIAAGGGGYLAVWEDWRTDFAGVPDNYLASGGDFTGQLLKDIYAV